MPDWRIIKEDYGLDKIRETSLKSRQLDRRTLYFCANLFNEPLVNFRCYTEKLSNSTTIQCS